VKSYSILPAVLLAASVFVTPGQAITLVEDRKPRAVIILPEKPTPSLEAVARVLRDHVKQISGAELPVRTEDRITGSPRKDEAWVLVGAGRLAQELKLTTKGLGAGGIYLSAKGPVLALLGMDAASTDPDGTRHAVTTFLEDKLGIRYLWPGETGKVIPRSDSIVVKDFEYRFAPRLAQRRIRSMSYHDRLQVGLDRLGFTREDYLRLRGEAEHTRVESPDWFAWHRLGGSLNLSGGHAFGHLWAKYGKEHPDWFALQPDGSRDQSRNPDRARLCKSNTDLIDAIAREKIEDFKRNPALLGAAIGPNDGGRNSFCSCPKCEALDSPRGRKVMLWDFTKGRQRTFEHVSLTDRMVWFWNGIAERVAKVYPDKFLVVDAYSVYAPPPVLRKLHPNLVVRFAPLGYHSEEYRQESLRDWEGWSKAAKRIYFRPNLMLLGRRDAMPLVYVHKFAKDFRYLAEHGMMGTDFDACCHHWATQGLNYYVVARLHWDPEANVDALVDDYCRSGFGPAAGAIRRYFDGLETIMNEAAARNGKIAAAFTPEAIAGLRKHMDEARKQAAGDMAIAKRIAFLELALRWTEVETRAHALLADTAKADKAAAKKVLDERFALMKEVFQKTPLAVNVAYVSWGEDGLWARLGWKRP
jgi:hypothetical protein